MEPEDEDLTTFRNLCDESKCVSKGRSNQFKDSFTCYGDEIVFPMMCADGYIPITVRDEQYIKAGEESEELEASIDYFTCCPPRKDESSVSASSSAGGDAFGIRRCSDPITVDQDKSFDFRCDSQETRKYPRQMKSSWDENGREIRSFVCCDSNQSDEMAESQNTTLTTINLLEHSECVPYRDDWYMPAVVKNEVGRIEPIVCLFSNGDFAFPRAISDENQQINSLGGYRYQCCRTGPALPDFLHDRAFKLTLYPALILNVIALIISIIVVASLLIPFVKQSRQVESYRRRSSDFASSSRSSRVFRSSVFRNSNSSNISSIPSRSRTSKRQPRSYSTYNLYLVHLSLFDLVFCIFQVIMMTMPIAQYYAADVIGWVVDFPHTKKTITAGFLVWAFYGLANMGINVIVCHEVLVLLKASKKLRRITGPSLSKVNLQVGVVLLISLVCGISFYYANTHFPGNETPLMLIMLAMMFLMFSYVVYVPLSIWWNAYLPSNETGVRQLALYFLRIVGVFLLIWIPSGVITLCIWFEKNFSSWDILVILWLLALQPILTFCMILTKEDAKKYIVDFVTFSHCRKNKAIAIQEKRNTCSALDTSPASTTATTRNHPSSWPQQCDGIPTVGIQECGDDYLEEGKTSDVSISLEN